jgi:predicted DNA-binding transcriptional regulator AlpA
MKGSINKQNPEKEFLNRKDVLDILGVCRSTLWLMIKRGDAPPETIRGRWRKCDFDAFYDKKAGLY